jgi:hypothetical protein
MISPCLQKQYSFSLPPWQYSHQVNYYLSGESIALSLFPLSYLLSPLPAIGKKILNQKVFFFVLRYFLLIAQTQRIKRIWSPKREIKKFPLFFSHLFFISLLRGED